MSRVLIAAAATAALLLSASSAHAKVVRAEGILPPGQSGFVSVPGVASGSGSPHAYDQTQPFTEFRWKPLLFQDNATGAVEPKPGVRITRDAYGVPRVDAPSEQDAWWGVGYAVAQDRYVQFELFERATTGRLAEILGRSYVDDDRIARRDYYTDEELLRMFRALPAGLKQRADAYRAGANAYFDQARNDPDQTPGEFVALGTTKTEFTEVEQAAIGVFLARTVPSGDGNELRNLIALREAGRKALDALNPIRQPRETYTIPPRDATFPNQPGRTRRHERRAYARTLQRSRQWEVPKPAAQARVASDTRATGGSYMYATRDAKGHAYLFNGPQLGYSAPELFVEWEVHYPGVDLRGVGAAGVPVVGIGHNGTVAWGFTSGLSDEDDLYAEELTAEGGETYRFKGAERRMDCRDEVIRYQSPPIDLTGGSPPESGSETERVCRTVHGPVQVRAGKTAYARRYAIWGREIETLTGIDALNRARTIEDVDAAMNQVTWNENVMAIDSEGNMGFWHPGLHQLRPRRWDERLPYPGTGEAEWRGLRDRRRTPRVINPKQGWLANWNNLPAKGWTTGDGESDERLSAQFHRGQFLQRAVARLAKAGPTYEGMQDTLRFVGTHAQQRPLAQARLSRAARGATGNAERVLDALLAWGGSYHQTDDDGTVDPGVAIWEQYKDEVEEIALARLGKGAERLTSSRPGSSHRFDITNGEAYGLRTASLRERRAAAEATFTELAKRFGTDDVAKWREPRAMYDWMRQGAQQPPPIPFFDRGTWEQFAETAP